MSIDTPCYFLLWLFYSIETISGKTHMAAHIQEEEAGGSQIATSGRPTQQDSVFRKKREKPLVGSQYSADLL